MLSEGVIVSPKLLEAMYGRTVNPVGKETLQSALACVVKHPILQID